MKIILLDLDNQLNSAWTFINEYLHNQQPPYECLSISKANDTIKVDILSVDPFTALSEFPSYLIINLVHVVDDEVLEQIFKQLNIWEANNITNPDVKLYFHGNDKGEHWSKLNSIINDADNNVTMYTHALNNNGVPESDIWEEILAFFSEDNKEKIDYIDLHAVNRPLLPLNYAMIDISTFKSNNDFIEFLNKINIKFEDSLDKIKKTPDILDKKISQTSNEVTEKEKEERKSKLKEMLDILDKISKNKNDNNLEELKTAFNNWFE